jgi:hypothetical protein
MARFKWTVEFEVDETWVADGFNLTDIRALDMLMYDLDYAYSHELGAKVIKAPSAERIAKAQGYENSKTILHEIEEGRIKA